MVRCRSHIGFGALIFTHVIGVGINAACEINDRNPHAARGAIKQQAKNDGIEYPERKLPQRGEGCAAEAGSFMRIAAEHKWLIELGVC